MPDPITPDDLAELGLARDEEALFARDFDGRLIRVDAPSRAALTVTVARSAQCRTAWVTKASTRC